MDLEQTLAAVQCAGRHLLAVDGATVNQVLRAVADAAVAQSSFLLEENRKDLSRMDPGNPKYDRLRLTEARLQEIADGLRQVAALPSPLGRVLKERTLPNGLHIRRVSVPFGVIAIIYEARPNVSFDVFSLCLKAGSACVLKGGSDADCSNRAIVQVIHEVLRRYGMDTHVVELLPSGHEATARLLRADRYVDLVIPRGSSRLIQFVKQNATIPVIETGAGICHTYFDRAGDIGKGAAIVHNAKTRRVSVCNALDCLLVHADRLVDLPALCAPLVQSNVLIYADEPAFASLSGHYPSSLLAPATADSYGTEFLDYKMAIKTVDSLDEALAHIRRYGSRHSESIVTEDRACADRFLCEVDAACVYHNAPTSFTDGGQFGLGAEIGISTQKLHARGPMALEEITTYKWLIEGNGQTRK
ncbi:MAG: glutamate-5-semialdehyde dehydrogenase [Candidatus Bacteroides intestinipullorum]|uniref:Gamma-glutamyl phosphate reductase n=1 Tax=Candidatus Bacteroides intestinipullorum TaxID=2838471 RepID=A0A9E2NP55_9BACE|nr:glutamate-5-semialdehyde dehydrogenase [Candidatus Bacteroides intestinipullorum]